MSVKRRTGQIKESADHCLHDGDEVYIKLLTTQYYFLLHFLLLATGDENQSHLSIVTVNKFDMFIFL